jgi:DNA-binding transcriptional ArsR family regulator
MSAARAAALGPVLRAVSDDTRREMLEMLRRGPLSANELGVPFSISAPAVSQHLAVLREAMLVEVERRGTYRIYRLRPEPLAMISRWISHTETEWQRSLNRLEGVLAKIERRGGKA